MIGSMRLKMRPNPTAAGLAKNSAELKRIVSLGRVSVASQRSVVNALRERVCREWDWSQAERNR